MINDLSATDALLLLEDLSSNEANASSLDYDTDEAENYFLKDDGLKLTKKSRRLSRTPPHKKVYIIEDLKAKKWMSDDGEFGSDPKAKIPITMIVAAGYSILDLAATAVANEYTSDTDVSDEEDVAALIGISSSEKSSSFDSKITLPRDCDCCEDDDCKVQLDKLPMEVDNQLEGIEGVEVQQGEIVPDAIQDVNKVHF
jgi:hypothetical protein